MQLAATELCIMIRTLAICSILALSACAVWPAGKDPRGRALIEKANPVLVAANEFKRSHGANPESLDVLVPDFIGALPNEPQLSYDPKRGLFRFTYSPTFAAGQCICVAEIGANSFNCRVCYM